MATNQDATKEIQDADLEKARKSMGGRIDPDPTPAPTPEPPKEPVKEEPKKDVTPEPKPEGDKKPEGEDKKPDISDEGKQKKTVSRPEAYIPMPKYLSEKKEWERKATDAEAKAADALKKVEELSAIAGQKEGAQKDEDIEAFMEQTGFTRETVEGLLKLAEKRILTPERMEALKTTESVVKEAEMEAAFEKEFSEDALPSLKKLFPTISSEQIEQAKKFLDQVSHTKDFHTKTLEDIISEKRGDIEKMLNGEGDKPEEKEEPGDTAGKKTLESKRVGAGKTASLTVKDFEGVKDFSALDDMEQAERSALIKDFPADTYANFKAYVKEKEQSGGVEVTRDGQRVILK